MPIFDVLKYKIRVILSRDYYSVPSKQYPRDIEGTIIELETFSNYANKKIKSGDILELLAGRGSSCEDGVARIRWDHDVKSWIDFGTMIIRSSNINICNNIWKEYEDIRFDTRPYHRLQSQTSVSIASMKYDLCINAGAKTFSKISINTKTEKESKNQYLNNIPINKKYALPSKSNQFKRGITLKHAIENIESKIDLNKLEKRAEKLIMPQSLWERIPEENCHVTFEGTDLPEGGFNL